MVVSEYVPRLHCRDNTLITSTNSIEAEDIKQYVAERVKKREFPKNCILTIYQGVHGKNNGKMIKGKAKPKGNKCEHDMVEFSTSIRKKLDEVKREYEEIVKEMKYWFCTDFIGDEFDTSDNATKLKTVQQPLSLTPSSVASFSTLPSVIKDRIKD